MALNYDKLRQTRTHSGGGVGWKPREGISRIRVLPPSSVYFDDPGALENLALVQKLHFFQRDGYPTEVSRCLRDTGQPCPACAVWRAHKSSADPGFQQMAKDISPSDQYLFNIIDLDHPEAGIQVFTSNWTCWDKIMEIGVNPDWGDIIHPVEGTNFTIEKGKNKKTGRPSYSVVPDREKTSITSILQGIENWKGVLDDLPSNYTETKTPAEISGFLAEKGFPGYPEQSTAPAPSQPPTPPTLYQPSPQPSIPGPGSPPPTPSPVPTPSEEASKPECFGDYNPEIHPCPSCSVQGGCQEKYLGIG